MSEAAWRSTLVLLAALHLGLATWAAVDARSFTDRVADLGPYNPHLVHDFAAASATFGIGLLVAIGRRGWRTPVLGMTATWTGLHAVSHVVDVGDAHPDALGPTEAVALAVAAALLATLTLLSTKEDR
jgi:hypothetical protein